MQTLTVQTISKQDLRTFLQTRRGFVTVDYTKRDGSERQLTFLIGVDGNTGDDGGVYDPVQHGKLVVTDVHIAKQIKAAELAGDMATMKRLRTPWRSVDLETVTRITAMGSTYVVV